MTLTEKRAVVRAYEQEGTLTVSPKQAAEILDCKPYTLNVTARHGGWDYRKQGYFSGRNLRIYVSWLSEIVGQ